MIKKPAFIISFLLLSTWIDAQKIFDSNYIFYPSVGISIQRHLFGDIGLCYGSGNMTGGSCGSGDVFFPKIGTELTVNSGKLILGPKFSCEYVDEFLGARINIIDYTDFKIQDWRLTPEIGISLSAVLDLYYGYNIPLTRDRISCASGNRITLTMNLLKI